MGGQQESCISITRKLHFNNLHTLQQKTLAVKNFGEFGKLQQFTKFFANFRYFHNIPCANGLQFMKVFSAKLPTVLIH